MKLKHKKESKLQKGITLIALVITIIVLLILAGVSIATLTGDNGILTKAQTAKEETQKASDEEQRQLAILNAAMNTEKYDYETEDKGEDGKPITVPIPAGFAPTGIEGENSVADGLVVVDSKGNEFVWIPVTSNNQYTRNKNYKSKAVSEAAFNDEEYLPNGVSNEEESVRNVGGFYISRYEAGKEGNSEPYILVSKKDATVWNNITQEECKKESKKFINNNDVKSALISGIQWDLVMNFINKKLDGNGRTFNVEEYDSSRHINKGALAGQNIADKICNIYDLEGNYYEYIAEKTNFESSFIARGGYWTSYKDDSASGRYNNPGIAYMSHSFRFMLYVIET